MAASPVRPVLGVAGWAGLQEGAASRRLISGTVSGIMPGVGGRRLIGPDRWWRVGVGAVAQLGGGDGADGEGGHDEDGVAGDRVVEADLGLVEAEVVFAELEAFFDGPAQSRGADQPGLGHRLAFGDVAVMERPVRRWSGGGGSAG